MRVDIWSDIVCPWCAIGKAHFASALQRFEHADRVQVVWRSFELDPGAPVSRDGAYDALLASKYGASLAGGVAMVGRLSAAAERAGIDARFDLVRPTNSFDAHRLLHLAKERGRQDALTSRLMVGYLAEGQLLSDHEVLERLAVEVGLSAEDVRDVLTGARYAQQVRDDQAEAGRREITSVPTFLVDDRLVIPGAQSADSMLASLRRAWGKQPAQA